MLLPIILLSIVCIIQFVIIADQLKKRDSSIILWLEAFKRKDEDVRDLTETLLRAEGKPVVFRRRGPLEPSPGWFDKKGS